MTDRDVRLQQALEQISSLLERHRVLETWTHNQNVRQRELLEALVHRQNVAELHHRVRALHPADLAYILEALTPVDRMLVWNQLGNAQASAVLPEASKPVREELVSWT